MVGKESEVKLESHTDIERTGPYVVGKVQNKSVCKDS
jgi:hypothetical protein